VRSIALAFAAAALAAAADMPPMANTGAPLAVQFKCDAEQLDAAGLDCTPDRPCHVYLELTALEVVGAKVFVIGNLHTRNATLSSILLGTSDEGKTWTEPYDRLPLTALEGIQFIDFEHGWIAGETAQPVPRDPFFLITADGGKTWKRQFVFEEDHPGAVESFQFRSASEGVLVLDTESPGDRHELYQTRTGGAEWTLQTKSSKPLASQAARLSDENSDWRIRADARTSTYDIEKRSGDAWQPMVRFVINVAVCGGQ
jgi:photosystem II stability/assembly factor-like uncharacterized protein